MQIEHLLETYQLNIGMAERAVKAYAAMMEISCDGESLQQRHIACVEFIASELNIPSDLTEVLALGGNNIKLLLD